MNDLNVQHIWNPATGITDLEGSPDELNASHIPGIKAVWADQQQRLKGNAQLSRFTEKLSREWAIETGIIENLYEIDRGVTRTLIEHGFKAELLSHGSTNKPREYVLQLLRDQQNALEGISAFIKDKRHLSTSYIKELHGALLRSQETTEAMDSQGKPVQAKLIKGDWKKLPNSPMREGITYTYCPPEQVASEMDQLITMYDQHVENEVSGEVRAAWLHHRFTQIHPFQDGNGRVARAIASLVLVKDGLFPLVVTRDKRSDYLNALEAADQSDLKPLVDLIVKLQMTQFHKATAISEKLLVGEDIDTLLSELPKAADKIAAERRQELNRVFEYANALEHDIEKRLGEITQRITDALQKIEDNARSWVKRSDNNNSFYFRTQIIRNARQHIDYFVDTGVYRSWVSLDMHWSRRGKLVFAIHGIGKPFNGSLICAPFLEFRDVDDEGHTDTTFTPLTDEGFVFFYNEDQQKLLTRFESWRENIIKTAIRELLENL